LPLSPELRDAVERDDEPLTENERFTAARPATASVASSNRLPRARETRVRNENVENHDQVEDSVPDQPEPAEPAEGISEEVAPPAAPPRVSLASQVGELLASEGYSVAELLTVLRDVKKIGAKVEMLEQCPPDTLSLVLDDWENCKLRLDSKRVPQ
jgi:hypothetical protein